MVDELHVVALSGGKDSTALALRLREVTPVHYTYVCTPTGDELPELYDHWKRLGERLQSRIIPVIGGTLNGLIRDQQMLPNFRARWCTRMLKIEPFNAWLIEQQRRYEAITVYVGLRADEEERVGNYTKLPGITWEYPLRDWGWGLREVQDYLVRQRVTIPARTDCARCFYQRLGQWWDLWKEHPEIYQEAVNQEAMTGHTFRSSQRDTWPTSLVELRDLFEAGQIPPKASVQRDLFADLQCQVCRL